MPIVLPELARILLLVILATPRPFVETLPLANPIPPLIANLVPPSIILPSALLAVVAVERSCILAVRRARSLFLPLDIPKFLLPRIVAPRPLLMVAISATPLSAPPSPQANPPLLRLRSRPLFVPREIALLVPIRRVPLARPLLRTA